MKSRMELMSYEERLAMREPPEVVICEIDGCNEDITYGAQFSCEDCGAVVCDEHFHSLAAEHVDGPDKLLCEKCNEKRREQRKAA